MFGDFDKISQRREVEEKYREDLLNQINNNRRMN